MSDYVRLLNLSGEVKTARRHHSIVDMQFEFRIEALGNDFHLNACCCMFDYRFASIDIYVLLINLVVWFTVLRICCLLFSFC